MMLTVYEDTENIFNALAAGASGYMLKRTAGKELLEAIREVQRGGSPMTTHIARKVVQSFQRSAAATAQTENLSEREQQVLDLLSQGLIYKEIADKLEHQLRDRPHLHPAHLRKIAGAHADGSGGEIFAEVMPSQAPVQCVKKLARLTSHKIPSAKSTPMNVPMAVKKRICF